MFSSAAFNEDAVFNLATFSRDAVFNHLAAGLKGAGADGRTSHLLSAQVQFLSELLIVEVAAPTMTRPRNPNLYDVPLLTFGATAE